MLAVGVSYRQTIRAYPHGGGSYIVASENLGRTSGLVAAAGLMTDYVLTVAVSVGSPEWRPSPPHCPRVETLMSFRSASR